MDWNNDDIGRKWKLIVIGASALGLALIAFSGVCWGTLSLCGVWAATMKMEFWEFFGLSIASAVTFLLLRPLRKRMAARSVSTFPFQRMIPPEPPDLPPPHSSLDQLPSQLTRDERRMLKSTLEQYFGDKKERG